MSTTALATASPSGISAPMTQQDQAAILRALNLDPKDPKTQALVLTCQRYGLDPLLKHAVLISGTLYVTRDGLMHVAHMSGKFDGIEVEFLQETNTHYIARASVWRKDMTRPFVYQGRFPKNGKNTAMVQFGPEMAEKVAECRALRRAFSIALCSREEAWEEEYAPEAPQRTTKAPENVTPPRPQSQDPEKAAAIAEFTNIAGTLGEDVTDPNDRRALLCAILWPTEQAPARPATTDEWKAATQLLKDNGLPKLAEVPPAPPAPESKESFDLADPFAGEEG